MDEIDAKYFQRAEKLIEIDRFREAIPLLTKAYTENPQDYQVVCSLSFCFLKLDDDDKSIKYAEEAISVNPEGDWAYTLKAGVLFRQGKHKDALEYIQKAVRRDPEDEEALGNLVRAYLHNNQVLKARKTAEKLLEMAPDSAETHFIFGLVEDKSLNYKAAEKCFRQALKILPTYAEARSALGIVIQERSKREKEVAVKQTLQNQAFEHFNESVKLDPNNPDILENIKLQFNVSDWIFFVIYLSPFLFLGMAIDFASTLIISVLISLVVITIVEEHFRQKKKLSPELKAFLKIRDYKLFAKETFTNFFQSGKVFYQNIWKHALVALTIVFLYNFININDPQISFWTYLALFASYWINFFWMAAGMLRYAGPK